MPVEQILGTLTEVFGVDTEVFRQRHRGSALRAVASRMLIRFGGQTQRQVAEHLDMGTGGAVSAQVRTLPRRLVEDRGLRRKVQAVEERLLHLRDGR